MTGTRGWLLLIAGITGFEIWAAHNAPDELLSRALDRARATHPVANIAICAVIAATAGHLTRLTPPRLDVFALLHIA